MPKILIKEDDRTLPGTPDSYANYAVLIAGFQKTTFLDKNGLEDADAEAEMLEARAKAQDANGVYTFSSSDDFDKVIGLVPPKTEIDSKVVYHYGNQMAYELLKMGYPIIYKPITSLDEIDKEEFWEVFKDKASYDFRFVTHGLLESTGITDIESYETASSRKGEVEKAIEALETIANKWSAAQEANDELEEALYKDEQFSAIRTEYPGFINQEAGTVYKNYDSAVTGTTKELTALKQTLENLKGGISRTTINKANLNIANLACYSTTTKTNSTSTLPGRGDCIALIELDETTYNNKTAGTRPEELICEAIKSMEAIDTENGQYCAMTVPSVCYKMSIEKDKPNEFDNNVKFPGAFHYLACFINSLKLGFNEWYAAAGYTRGVASYTVDYTTVKLGEIAINTLEPRYREGGESAIEPAFACNVIAYFRGSYYLWGNRTAHPLGTKGSSKNGDLVARSFLNIRQLCTTIKKQLYVACRSFTFDPNSDTLWINFVNAIKPTLEAMKADQGIRDYKILKDTDNTKKATLKAKIRIIPIEAVEDFDLTVSLEDSFGETTAVVNE